MKPPPTEYHVSSSRSWPLESNAANVSVFECPGTMRSRSNTVSWSTSNAIARSPLKGSRLLALISIKRFSASPRSTAAGQQPTRPSRIALSVACPFQVQASDPNSVTWIRATAADCERSSCVPRKRPAAFMGPVVREDDGPMPILNKSKTLIIGPQPKPSSG